MKEIDELFKKYYKQNSPGAAILISKKQKILLQKGYGFSNLEKRIPVTPNTTFRLASVSKEFTAVAILQLIKKNKLNIHTRLTEIFPNFPDYGKDITILHLLDHTSGLKDYEKLIPKNRKKQISDKEVLDLLIKQKSTYFKPGTKFRYSNSGYCLLKLIIEKISKKSFDKFLKKNIFDPIGMKNTLVDVERKSIIKNRAYGYSKSGKKFIRTDQNVTSATEGDGSIYSSIKDLYKWDQALYTDKILSKKLLRKAFSLNLLSNKKPAMYDKKKKFYYGFGWVIKKEKNYKILFHQGASIGFRDIIYRIPKKKFTIIFLSNRNEGDTLEIAEKIITFKQLDKQ